MTEDKKKKKKPTDDEGSEKTGRWTDEEHTRFLHGLELFGKKWTKVADIVGTRTTVQVRYVGYLLLLVVSRGCAGALQGGSCPGGHQACPVGREPVQGPFQQ